MGGAGSIGALRARGKKRRGEVVTKLPLVKAHCATGCVARDNISVREIPFRGFMRCSTRLVLAATSFALPICPAQTDAVATFGSTVVIPGGLKGQIYLIEPRQSRSPSRRSNRVGAALVFES
jgi:hypothetical protein